MKKIKCTCFENQKCGECEELKDDIIQFEPGGDDEEDIMGWICKDCLKKALIMLRDT